MRPAPKPVQTNCSFSALYVIYVYLYVYVIYVHILYVFYYRYCVFINTRFLPRPAARESVKCFKNSDHGILRCEPPPFHSVLRCENAEAGPVVLIHRLCVCNFCCVYRACVITCSGNNKI